MTVSSGLATSARLAREVLVTLGAVLGTLFVVGAVAGATLGIKPLVFLSGSMAPAIPTGSLALARTVPAHEVDRGDVVSVLDARGVRVSHRVVDVEGGDGTAILTLQGDANEAPDRDRYPVTSVDRIFLDVPGLGYVAQTLGSPAGIFAGGLLVGGVILLCFRPARQRGRRAATPAVVAVLAVSVGTLGASSNTPTWAAWHDAATLTSGTVATHHVLPPLAVGCAPSGQTATMSWVEKDSRYDYEVVLRNANGEQVVLPRLVTGSAVSTTYTAPAGFGMASLGLGRYDYTVEVRSYLAGTPSWRSTSHTVASQTVRVDIGLWLAAVYCV